MENQEYPTNPRMNEGKMAEITRQILLEIGEDSNREGLIRTPERVERAWSYLTSGYATDLNEIVNNAIFEENCDEIVMVKHIHFFSFCEHHLLPFYGTCAVGYIPNGKIIGLSKIPRIVDMFARRLQLQERMTMQIAETIQKILQPQGVAVVTEANHLCMMMRGVEKQDASAVSSAMLGVFRDNRQTRAEFLSLLGVTQL